MAARFDRPEQVTGTPYRPLYQVVDRAAPATSADGELRPFGVLLIVLGLLRILPTVVAGMPCDVELAVAVVMLGVGWFFALGIRRRSLRWRRPANQG
jgi:hypothetical protein